VTCGGGAITLFQSAAVLWRVALKNASNTNGSSRVFYTVEEVAGKFGVSRKTVYRLLDRGLLKSSSALRHKMILGSSIDEFVVQTVHNGGGR